MFDAEPEVKPNLPEDAPVAIVEELGASTDIVWENLGGFYPSNPNQQLDTVYSFKAPHNSDTVQESKYEEWYCDYYVRLETTAMEKLPKGYITLGGNYGSWGWIGFDNP